MKFKFALVEGVRRQAESGLKGKCIFCGAEMTAKCGQIRVHHWAHRRTLTCDRWWEPETEWHRAWKDQFPLEWQEIIQESPQDGEKHIADVKTKTGVVLEFQYSFLRRDERESREKFYQNMLWVVYGRRRKRDMQQFFACLKAGNVINHEPVIVSVVWTEGALLRDWGVNRLPVYFDFGNSKTLWRLDPHGPDGTTYPSPMTKAEFLRVHLAGEPFDRMFSEVIRQLAAARSKQAPQSRELTGFDRHMARKQRTRPRF